MTNGNDFVTPLIEMSQSSLEHPVDQHFGLTKREYFAAMAMQGMLSDARTVEDISDKFAGPLQQLAVIYADKLIEALNK